MSMANKEVCVIVVDNKVFKMQMPMFEVVDSLVEFASYIVSSGCDISGKH